MCSRTFSSCSSGTSRRQLCSTTEIIIKMAEDQNRLSPSRESVESKHDDDDDAIVTSTSAWLSDWWQTAKEKSTSALEFMKRDLTEFSQVVQNDTASVVSNTTAILKEKLRVDDSNSVAGRAKQGFNDLLQTVSGALYPTREPDDHELVVIRDSEAVLLDKWQAELYEIQHDLSTFSHEPQGPPELYEKWLESFDLQDKQEEITCLLHQSPEVQGFYNNLVSTSVSEIEFWQRYFYRVWQLKNSKRADLARRAHPKPIEEELPWDDDEEAPSTASARQTSQINKSIENTNLSVDFISVKPSAVPEAERVLVKEIENFSAESDGSNISAPSCNSSEKGTSDEWEKDFDLELNDSTFSTANCESIVNVKEEDEDWENWE